MWLMPGVLGVPFDRALTQGELADVTRLLTSATDTVAADRALLENYLSLGTTTTNQNTAAIKALVRSVLAMLDQQ